jgi:CheY-like chemotaxis protein
MMNSGAHAGSEKANLRSHRILIVDDEETIVVLFRSILYSAFARSKIDTVGDGAKAVECFKARQHGVLLMDLHMPVMDGFRAFQEIEEICRGKAWDMPAVLFCTGFAPPETLARVIAEDPRHGYLPKPISPAELIDAVEARLPG